MKNNADYGWILACPVHPDGFAVDYAYDLLNRPVAVKNGARTLAAFGANDWVPSQSLYAPHLTTISGGAREFVVRNGPIPSGAQIVIFGGG